MLLVIFMSKTILQYVKSTYFLSPRIQALKGQNTRYFNL